MRSLSVKSGALGSDSWNCPGYEASPLELGAGEGGFPSNMVRTDGTIPGCVLVSLLSSLSIVANEVAGSY